MQILRNPLETAGEELDGLDDDLFEVLLDDLDHEMFELSYTRRIFNVFVPVPFHSYELDYLPRCYFILFYLIFFSVACNILLHVDIIDAHT